MALLSSRSGKHADAQHSIDEADTRCNRVVDRYVWVQTAMIQARAVASEVDNRALQSWLQE